MTLLYTAVAVACINVFGIVCFAITGFGNGILYQLGEPGNCPKSLLPNALRSLPYARSMLLGAGV